MLEKFTANGGRMILVAVEEPQECSVCDTLQPCVIVVDDKEQTVIGHICRRDLARALEAITGFQVVNMIDNMLGVAALRKHPFRIREVYIGKESE